METFMLDANGQQVIVNVSPRTRDMLMSDEEFRNQFFQQAVSQDYLESELGPSAESSKDQLSSEGYPQGISPLPSPVGIVKDGEGGSKEPFADPCGSKICWLEKDVKLLITLYKELSEFLGKTPKCKSKAKMFREISKRMAEHGCSYSPIQVEIKWRSLEKKYKKSLQHNQKTGRNRMKIEFESELGEILNKKAGVIPEYVLNTSDSGKSRHDIMEDLEIEDDDSEKKLNATNDTDDGISSTPKSARPTRKSTIRGVLDQYREDRQAGETAKSEFRENFLSAYNRRTEAVERKNALLESLINSMNTNRS